LALKLDGRKLLGSHCECLRNKPSNQIVTVIGLSSWYW
jgi:hypothetical protein